MKTNIVIVDDNEDMFRGPKAILADMDPLRLGGERLTWDVHTVLAQQGVDGSVDIEALATEVGRFRPGVAVIDMRL